MALKWLPNGHYKGHVFLLRTQAHSGRFGGWHTHALLSIRCKPLRSTNLNTIPSEKGSRLSTSSNSASPPSVIICGIDKEINNDSIRPCNLYHLILQWSNFLQTSTGNHTLLTQYRTAVKQLIHHKLTVT